MKQKRKNKPHAVEDILCEESACNPFIMVTRALPHSIAYTGIHAASQEGILCFAFRIDPSSDNI